MHFIIHKIYNFVILFLTSVFVTSTCTPPPPLAHNCRCVQRCVSHIPVFNLFVWTRKLDYFRLNAIRTNYFVSLLLLLRCRRRRLVCIRLSATCLSHTYIDVIYIYISVYLCVGSVAVTFVIDDWIEHQVTMACAVFEIECHKTSHATHCCRIIEF